MNADKKGQSMHWPYHDLRLSASICG